MYTTPVSPIVENNRPHTNKIVNLLAPLSKVEEVEPLLDAGADEFYCGFIPPEETLKHLNCHSGNRASNFDSYEELRRAAELIHNQNKKLFIALNIPVVNEQHYPHIQELIIEFLKIKIDAVIASDGGLILYLKENNPSLEIHLSTVTGVFNSYAVKFFREMGVKRIVLPDHLSLDEIETLAERKGPVIFEMFALNNRCINLESFCTFHHRSEINNGDTSIGKKITAASFVEGMKNFFKKLPPGFTRKLFNSPLSVSVYEKFVGAQKHLSGCKLNYKVAPLGKNYTEDLVKKARQIQESFGPHAVIRRMDDQCGVCGIFSARQWGVEVVKLDGRYLSAQRKIRDTRFLRECLDCAGFAKDIKEFTTHCKAKRKEILGYRCSAEHCYYPDLWKM